MQDSRGFIWFCTRNGLSRFDGHQFTTFNTANGLPHSTINFLLESRNGVYWIATNGGGVCRLVDASNHPAPPALVKARPLFAVYSVGDQPASNRVNVLYEDRAGAIWAGTDGGLFRLEETDRAVMFNRVNLGPQTGSADESGVSALMGDSRGALWVGMNGQLCRIPPNRPPEHYSVRQGLPAGAIIWSLLEDRQGRIWAATKQGLYLLVLEPNTEASIVERRYTTADGLAHNTVVNLHQTADGLIWISTAEGLCEFDGVRIRPRFKEQGLSEPVGPVLEDRDGNLWMGTFGSGVLKLIRNGLISYGEADAPGLTQIYSIFENDAGELFTVGDNWQISHSYNDRFASIRPNIPEGTPASWLPQLAFLDHAGEWWIAINKRLYRFPRVASAGMLSRVRPGEVYSTADGLPGEDVHRFFEASRGDLWLSIPITGGGRLFRWERATRKFHEFTEAEGLPPNNLAFAFREDRAGDLWIGFYEGGVGRLRNGRLTLIVPQDGTPAGVITSLFLDQSGRLWITSNRSGVTRIDDPTADNPQLINYTLAEGLSSNDTRCVTEDQWGRIYVGTVRGVDRLDLSAERITHYASADGLATDFVISALRDRRGRLWFGTMKGLSLLTPEPDRPGQAPPVLITGLSVAGVDFHLSQLGLTEASGLEFGPDENRIQIEFTGLSFALGDRLRFRCKLEGADDDWNSPITQRSINYANLRPGSYRFLVEAVSSNGYSSPVPAIVAFTIRAPFWQRWWFIGGIAALLGLGLYILHRYRIARLIELERVRTRIAADLHDDIGSSLSQIAIISEVLNKQIRNQEQSIAGNLSLMARVSREAVDSMSDIVWAINPQRDHLRDLVRRMRRFASETFPARNIAFSFHAPGMEHDLRLGADVRRQVFLIFKESVNNIVRHSGCTTAEVNIQIESGWLVLKIADNGQGFDGGRRAEGNGLVSMEQRALGLGGELEVSSVEGSGTTIALRVPRDHRHATRDRDTSRTSSAGSLWRRLLRRGE
jgi:ligand-binding sensor domain-containing protein/two-component sensor histidine kinase